MNVQQGLLPQIAKASAATQSTFWKSFWKIEYPMKMYSMHQRDSSPAAKIPTLCAWQASLSISEWGMRSGFDEQARRAPSSRLRKYDARCCIIFTEGYRSGHNEAVVKNSRFRHSKIATTLDFIGFFGCSSALCEMAFSQFSRKFLASFSQFFHNFRRVSNPFWIGSVTIWDYLIAYGGISKRS